MNRIEGQISNIQKHKQLIRVEIRVAKDSFYAIILDLGPDAGYRPVLRKTCSILFKETEVSIATDEAHQISISNRIPCILLDVEKEKILCRIKLQYEDVILFATLSSSEWERLNIKIGNKVTALVKENEVMLAN